MDFAIQAKMSADIVKRRQNSSCDQCRQGKRACDAQLIIKLSSSGNVGPKGTNLDGRASFPCCSYCRRTKKQCTFHRYQAGRRKSHSAILVEAPCTDKGSTTNKLRHSPQSSRQCKMSNVAGGAREYHKTPQTTLTPQLDLMSSQSVNQNELKVQLTKSLVRVYSDSLENALDCWLTEYNCPYTISKIGVQQTGARSLVGNVSCRILDRVQSLDRNLLSSDLVRSSQEDQLKASKALKLAMLAFAAQWSQGAERLGLFSDIDLYSHKSPETVDRGDLWSDKSFSRSVQVDLWHRAQQALFDAEAVMSGKVIFAFIVLSLAQRPLKERPNKEFLCKLDIQGLVDLEGPPLYLESAIRQLAKMRRILQKHARTKNSGPRSLGQEHHDTFDLLFWLGVMFDTLSSAIHERPIVVPDEDCKRTCKPMGEAFCDLDGWNTESSNEHLDTSSECIWQTNTLSSQSNAQHALTWPCEMAKAENLLRNAAPIKVLLFRRVGHLQTLVTRASSAARLETAIMQVLDVHMYWQKMFQPFIDTCVALHENLPSKLQSWYGVLCGHWHLAAMIFADVVDEIDTTSAGCTQNRVARDRSRFGAKWRYEHSLAVSQLADAARREAVASFAQQGVFHDALNESALLSEPWTSVLVRSFSRAAEFLLDHMRSKNPLAHGAYILDAAEKCIDVLRLIARKSDVAGLVSDALGTRLCQQRLEVTTSL